MWAVWKIWFIERTVQQSLRSIPLWWILIGWFKASASIIPFDGTHDTGLLPGVNKAYLKFSIPLSAHQRFSSYSFLGFYERATASLASFVFISNLRCQMVFFLKRTIWEVVCGDCLEKAKHFQKIFWQVIGRTICLVLSIRSDQQTVWSSGRVKVLPKPSGKRVQRTHKIFGATKIGYF